MDDTNVSLQWESVKCRILHLLDNFEWGIDRHRIEGVIITEILELDRKIEKLEQQVKTLTHDGATLNAHARKLEELYVYKEAVLSQCAVHHIEEKEHPYKTIGALLDLCSDIALDPLVSLEAKKLHDRIEGLEQQLAEHEWIPVSERLPDNTNLCLIYTKNKQYHFSFYSGGGWAFHNAEDVTHWKPINPPSEVK